MADDILIPRATPTVRQAGQVQKGKANAMSEFGSSMQGVADKFSDYYDQQATEEADLIWTQSQVDWGRSYSERAKAAGNGFTGTTMEEYDAHVEGVMKTVPLRKVDAMEHMYAKQRVGVEAKAFEREAAARAAARAKRLVTIEKNRHTLALESIEDGMPPDYVYKDMAYGLNEKQKRALLGVISGHVITSGDREATGAMVDDLIDGDVFNDITTAEERIKLRGQLERKNEVFAREDMAYLDTAIADAEAVAANTGEADLDGIEEFIDNSLLKPTDKKTARAMLKDRVEFGVDTYSIRQQPVAVSAAHYKDMPRKTAKDWSRVGRYAAAMSTHNDALAADAGGYLLQVDPSLAEAWAKTKEAGDPRETSTAFSEYSRQQEAIYDRMAVPQSQRRILPKAEASAQAKGLNDQENGITGAQGKMLLEQWGDDKNRVMAELVAEDLNSFVSAQIWRFDDATLNEDLAMAKNADDQQRNESYGSTERKDLIKTVNAALADYEVAFSSGRNPEAHRFFLDMQDVAIKTIMTKANRGDTVDVDKFLKKMFSEETVVANHARLLVPAEVSADMVTTKTQGLISDAYRALVPKIDPDLVAAITPYDKTDDPDKLVMAAVVRSQGMFILNSDGDGVVLTLGGQPVGAEYTFDELRTLYPPRAQGDPDEAAPPGAPRPLYTGDGVELQYLSATDPNYLSDLANGTIRSGMKVQIGDTVMIPIRIGN